MSECKDVGSARKSSTASVPRSSALSEMAVGLMLPSRSAAVSETVVVGNEISSVAFS